MSAPGDTAAGAHRSGEPEHSPGIASRSDEPRPHIDDFNGLVAEIRRRYALENSPIPRLEDRVRRRLGFSPMSAAAALLAGLVGVALRLALVLLATAIAGDWMGVPWGRWTAVLLSYAVLDAIASLSAPPIDVPAQPSMARTIQGWTALLPTMKEESDLRELAEHFRRWTRPVTSLRVGMAVATTMLVAAWLFAPAAFSGLPAGSVVLLTLLLFDFGSVTIFYAILLHSAFMTREARYDHRLFWPSPADSPEVRKAMQATIEKASLGGAWITGFLVLTVVLVSWDSPLVVPLGAGFIVIGYLATFVAALTCRASVQKIVQRAREQRLKGLRHRIDGFGPRYRDLSAEDSQQLRDLLFLYDKIRDAPTTPTATRTVVDTAVRLIVPTIIFLLTVFGEVYSERLLDAILP